MPQFETRRRVPFSPRQMFDLVADVERYPEFVPLCEALIVHERHPDGHHTALIASMRVGYKGIRETFKTRVFLDPSKPFVKAEYLDGPFQYLENRWSFLPAPSTDPAAPHCDIDFFITYEFKSMMLQLLMGAMFDSAFRKFTAAFEVRARDVYGEPVS
jgi:coenzyme Q-binding protein COQ10